jgi:hypothetical protein
MKKNLLTGLIAVGLITAGGTGFVMAKAQQKTQDPVYFMQQGMAQGQMTKMMNSANTSNKQLEQSSDSAFEQMLPYMKKMHPGLSDEQLKALFEQMHGANGPCSNGNAEGKGMMGKTNTKL